jgi:SAM-dependent methyltransferase
VLTISLAHLFEQTVGLDPDADMLAEGCRAAEEKGVVHIRWVQGLAEDLPAVAPGPYKLVTFGLSFHWTDEQQVAETVYDMLEPGGALALIVHTVTGRPRPPDPGAPPIPHDEIKALVAKYLGSTCRAGQGTAQERTHRFEDVLARTRFGVPQQLFVPGIPDLLRDSESVLSGYLSLSFSAPHLFGDRLDDFAGEVRTLLASRSGEGIFWDWPGDAGPAGRIHHSASQTPGFQYADSRHAAPLRRHTHLRHRPGRIFEYRLALMVTYSQVDRIYVLIVA